MKAQPGPGRRNFACQNYTRCLDLAVDLEWTSFTCGDCPERDVERPDWPEQQQRDLDGCIALVGAILTGRMSE